MFLSSPTAGKTTNRPFSLPAAIGGLNAYTSIMAMPPTDAVLLENFFPFPDRLETRSGYVNHIEATASTAYRLFNYSSGAGTETLFAATDTGVYDVTTAGASLPAYTVPLTNGKVSTAVLSTGANHYLMIVNGTDTLRKFDGSTWSTVATLGATSTAIFSYVEVYRQRLFFAEKNSLNLWYLPINSISGTPVSYALGAIFRRGGYIVALATWTLDSGYGPEDQLAVCTSTGEIAVLSGADPSSASSWSLRGVYYIGKPLGANPLYKYGGDVLFLSENGLYPLSQAVQSAAIERTKSVTDKIRQLFNDAANEFSGNEGWQVIAQPNVPFLLVNVPASPVRQQFVMHAQTGAWAKFTGWDAFSFARVGTSLYFSTAGSIKRVTGVSDAGANITATLTQAFSKVGSPRTKQVVEVKPYLVSDGGFSYSIGVVSDFGTLQEASNISKTFLGSSSLWGSAIWGSAIWGGTTETISEWQTVPDVFSTHKALYLQVVGNTASVSFYGLDGLCLDGGSF